MKDVTVAERYARALFLLVEKRKETAGALQDLLSLEALFEREPRVRDFLASPQVRLAEKRRALGEALEGKVLRAVMAFVDLLLRKKRLSLFAEIVASFEAQVERARGVQRALVVSALPLVEAEMKRLHGSLEDWTGKQIRMTTQVDPSLIGGAYVRIGDRVVDRSVRALLESMHRQLREVNV